MHGNMPQVSVLEQKQDMMQTNYGMLQNIIYY
jgi:hypothetical protein